MEEKVVRVVMNFFVRAVIGLCAIFIVNQLLEYQDIPVAVGMNLCTFLTSGVLGIPGVGLLYGIMFYQIL